jgi:hypothetical protein
VRRTYVTRPRQWWIVEHEEGMFDGGYVGARDVMSPEPETVATGVLDADGNMIYTRREMDPIGFVRFPRG